MYDQQGSVPFYISPDEFILKKNEANQLLKLGSALSEFFKILSNIRQDNPNYIFFRPDILLTEQGFKVCEVEFSPFGFPLTIFLEKAYNKIRRCQNMNSFSFNALEYFIETCKKRIASNHLIFLFSSHTRRFSGQFFYLSEIVAKSPKCTHLKLKVNIDDFNIDPRVDHYRCFYMYEEQVLKKISKNALGTFLPGPTPYYETKMPLVEFWQNPQVRAQLSTQSLKILDQMILPTYLIKGKAPGENFPIDLKNWEELGQLPAGQRMFVVKRVGGHQDSSWARSVIFLHKISGLATQQLLETALEESGQWIIQPFIKSSKVIQRYYSPSDKKIVEMKGRIRITPYYSFSEGRWLVGKATIRRNTLLIHGATDSINTLVTWEGK